MGREPQWEHEQALSESDVTKQLKVLGFLAFLSSFHTNHSTQSDAHSCVCMSFFKCMLHLLK